MAKACLFAPAGNVELAPVVKMVSTAMNFGGQKRQPPDDFKLVKGLSEFREGHFAAAISWLNKVARQENEPWGSVQIEMILAMAQHGLGRNDEASATLAQGLQFAELNTPKSRGRDFGIGWSDAVMAQALMREAKGIIQRKSGEAR